MLKAAFVHVVIWGIALSFFLFFLPAGTLQAEIPGSLSLMPSGQRHNLNPYLQILEDPAGELSIAGAASAAAAHQFEPHNDKKAPSYSYTESAVWLSFFLEKPDRAEWLLEVGYPLLGRVDFYVPHESGGFTGYQAGVSFPFQAREVEHRNLLFSIPSSWDEERPFFLRVQTQSAMVLPLTLWESNSFLAFAEKEYLSLGIYYGILAIIICCALLLYACTRTKYYLYYTFFIASVGIFQFTFNGLAFQFFWPAYPWWALNAINFFIFTGTFSALIFVRSIMPVKQLAPFVDRCMKVLLIFTALIIPLTLLLNFTLVMQLGIFTVLAVMLTILPATVICWHRHYRPAKYLLGGWVFLGLGVLLMIGRSLGFLPSTFITIYGTHFGFAVMVIFLSLGLAKHLHIFWRQKAQVEEVNKKLEIEGQKLLHTEALNALFREISVDDEISTIADKILVHIKKLIPYNRACFLSAKDSSFCILAQAGEGCPDVEERAGELLAENIFCEALDAGEPMLIPDLKEFNPLKAYSVQQDTSSALIIPLITKEKHFGVVVLENAKSYAYTYFDFSLAINFAAQANLSIGHAQLFQEINKLAVTDGLTGLYNRRHFYNLGEQEFSRARRYNLPLSLIIMDIDNFKVVNDTLGHAAGDEVLQVIAQRCRQSLRSVDIACRYGGEEFAVLLPETGKENAKHAAERLRQAIGTSPVDIKQQSFVTVTASFGIATLKADALYFDQLVDRADTALYEAKNKGKNAVIAF